MHVIAACTQSKRGPVQPGLRIEAYRALADIGEARNQWRAAGRTASDRRPLRSLYKGAYWSHALGLARFLEADLHVVSAGLGLANADDEFPPYAATFTPRLQDSVPGAATLEGRQRWWSLLDGSNHLRARLRVSELSIIVLPDSYLAVVAPDLLAADPSRLRVFAASAPPELIEHLGDSLISLDSRMVRPLRTNVGGLSPAAATHLLKEVGRPWDGRSLREAAATLVGPESPPLYPTRQRQTAHQVATWLREQLRSADRPSSATAALRRFRASGRAFEQKRFHRAFRDCVAELEGSP